ncbi:MAG: NAD(+)/NADH kinase [Lachnospiraceae bacterium]|nr:NAD(+)/NADH kinase [Lachnospiraceae bacterium]
MERFYIVANRAKDINHFESNRIKEYLEEHGKSCVLGPSIPVLSFEHQQEHQKEYRYTDAAQIPKGTQCILVIGGDGTLIQAARDLVELEIPLVGVNFGTLGYLTEVERENLYPSLDKLMRDDYQIEERMMLEGTVMREKKEIATMVALNDVVFSRSGALRVIDFKIYLNGEFLNFYSADGIIISTPTGSTGYNMSAGGPIVSPDAKLMVMTPICAHTLNNRSIVLSGNDQVTLEFCQDRSGCCKERLISFDGDNAVCAAVGDTVEIRRSKRFTRIVRLNKISFLEVLRDKMGGGK